jgi:hypothetical protein
VLQVGHELQHLEKMGFPLKSAKTAVMACFSGVFSVCFRSQEDCGLMLEPKIRLQVNVAVAAEAEGGRVGEGFQVAVCTGVVEQAF